MKLAALYSGGKDSTYSIYLAKKEGHEIKCLLTIVPNSDESHLLHHSNILWSKLQAKSLDIPQITTTCTSDSTENEISKLELLLKEAIDNYDIEGLVHGGIKSNFQKEKFESLCNKFSLKLLSPLWNAESKKYLNELIDNDFHFIIVSVSSDGLDQQWLGHEVSRSDVKKLLDLSTTFGFNPDFEGGEAETFVVNCPIFKSPLIIESGKKHWDGYRGRFEIMGARLKYDA